MSAAFNSIRMHASRAGIHVSGAESLVKDQEVEAVALELFQRAFKHPRGRADRIHLTIEQVVDSQIRSASLLPLKTLQVDSWQNGRAKAAALLTSHGIPSAVVESSIAALAGGAAAGGQVMRGAMLVDVSSGLRLEPDPNRGVRVSRMDIAPQLSDRIGTWLDAEGLSGPRVTEALVLASKVALYPQVVAELCWSDDPDYLTGYVASAQLGYRRITRMKAAGDMMGGRVLFVRGAQGLNTLIAKLQTEPVLFDGFDAEG